MSFPLKITDAALKRMISARESDGLNKSYFIRTSVKGGGCSGFQNELVFDNNLDQDEDVFETFVIDGDSMMVVADTFSAMYLTNVTLDFVSEDIQEGFKFIGGSAERKHCACGSSFSQ